MTDADTTPATEDDADPDATAAPPAGCELGVIEQVERGDGWYEIRAKVPAHVSKECRAVRESVWTRLQQARNEYMTTGPGRAVTELRERLEEARTVALTAARDEVAALQREWADAVITGKADGVEKKLTAARGRVELVEARVPVLSATIDEKVPAAEADLRRLFAAALSEMAEAVPSVDAVRAEFLAAVGPAVERLILGLARAQATVGVPSTTRRFRRLFEVRERSAMEQAMGYFPPLDTAPTLMPADE